MLYHNRIDFSEGIDVNKTSAFKRCIRCRYWYFLDKGFSFQTTVCKSCHNVSMMSNGINNIAIFNIYGINDVLFLQLAKLKLYIYIYIYIYICIYIYIYIYIIYVYIYILYTSKNSDLSEKVN